MDKGDLLVAIENGMNIIFHSPGGTGKSWTLKEIAKYCKNKLHKVVACTATTGVAAINLNSPENAISSSTLHSWAGIGVVSEDTSVQKLFYKVWNHPGSRDKWLATDVLIIDEISMLGLSLFDKLDYIGRKVRRSPDFPFGGIQLIVSGDFLQLPPVKDNWVFKSSVWEECKFTSVVLEEAKRYKDLDWFNMLLRIRIGDHTKEDVKKLYSRNIAYQKLIEDTEKKSDTQTIKPTILYSTNKNVQEHNEKELFKLPGASRTFIADDVFTQLNEGGKYEHYVNLLDDAIPKAVQFKTGAQVMLKVNLDVKQGYVNGSRGVVLDIGPDYMVVKFINGSEKKIQKHVWVMEDKDGKMTRTQMPFILAWALSIHKSQGCTLDYVICDLGPTIFTTGQAYVALSRVRDMSGLFISDFWPQSIKVNLFARDYAKKLKQNSLKLTEFDSSDDTPLLEEKTDTHLPEEIENQEIENQCEELIEEITYEKDGTVYTLRFIHEQQK